MQLAINRAQQEERSRISADIHDEIGSGITAIRLMSEVARRKMKNNRVPELDKISSSADDLLNKMHAIIWSMNNGNDSLANLIDYTKSWIREYFEDSSIGCRVIVPDFIPDKTLSGSKRRNIFLCVKELLNNIIKHAKASEVRIRFTYNELLEIEIADNGCGIDFKQKRPFGNGLINIRTRMENIGGEFFIRNERGTKAILKASLTVA
jgi:signal transduction histidine kinase